MSALVNPETLQILTLVYSEVPSGIFTHISIISRQTRIDVVTTPPTGPCAMVYIHLRTVDAASQIHFETYWGVSPAEKLLGVCLLHDLGCG